MANIIDYLLWRGDVPFSVDPFNEVDALIMTELVYEDFSGIVPDTGDTVDIARAAARFSALHPEAEIQARKDFTRQIPRLLELAGKAPRYAGMGLMHYCNAIEPSLDFQLAILSFRVPDGSVFVAYRGTDSSIVGWKEDFMLSYSPQTEGQRRAVAYLNERWSDCRVPLRVGGHSKGGNLAMYAAAKCAPKVREGIQIIYNHDGPGFLGDFIESEAYRAIRPRIYTIVPEFSVVGVLMENEARQHVVQSSAVGIMQHDGFSWQVLGNRFVAKDQRAPASQLIDSALSEWLNGLSLEDRRVLVQVLFGFLDATGAQTLHEIRSNKASLLIALRDLQKRVPKEQLGVVLRMMGQLLSIGSGMTINELKDALATQLNSMNGGTATNNSHTKP